jgi:hypothetical protein
MPICQLGVTKEAKQSSLFQERKRHHASTGRERGNQPPQPASFIAPIVNHWHLFWLRSQSLEDLTENASIDDDDTSEIRLVRVNDACKKKGGTPSTVPRHRSVWHLDGIHWTDPEEFTTLENPLVFFSFRLY